MKKIVKNLNEYSDILLVLLFVFMLLRHAVVPMGIKDDEWFLTVSTQQGFLQFTKWRMQVWTSRNLMEFVLISLLHVNKWVWIVLDSAMFVLLGDSLRKIAAPSREKRFVCTALVVLLLALFPFSIFGGAGWYTTTLTYLWPLALGFYVLSILMDCLRGESITLFRGILMVPALIYAANHEQMCALLVGFSVVLLLYAFYTHRKMPAYPYIVLGVAVVMLVWHALCPGNAARAQMTMAEYYPAFEFYSGSDKLMLGLIFTVSQGLVKPIYIVYVFNAVLLFTILYRKKRVNGEVVSLCGFSVLNAVISVSDSVWLKDWLYPVYRIFEPFMEPMDAIPYKDIRLYAVLLYFLVFVTFLLYLVCKYWGKSMLWMVGVLFLAAFCSRVLLGFSASVYESGIRTFINSAVLIVTAGLLCLFPERTQECIHPARDGEK